MRFHDLRKWKDTVYTRLEVARLHLIENILLGLCPQLRNRKYFTERVSTNGKPFAQCGKQRKRCWPGRECSIFEDCSTKSRSLSEQLDSFARNGVENHARPLAASNFVYPFDEVFFLGCNHVRRSNLDQRGFFLGRSRGCNADRAFRLRHFDGGDSHTAAGCRDDYEVTFCNLSMCNQRSIGRQVLHPDGRALFRRQLLWINRQRTGRNDRHFSIYAVLRHEERRNSTGFLAKPALVHVRANGFRSE